MNLPARRQIRLPDYDYSQNGAYFITVCTKDRQKLLWDAVGTPSGRPQLSRYGLLVEKAICSINQVYPNANVDRYVVMPNHIHLLLVLTENGGPPKASATISRVMNQMKGYVSRCAGFSIWQPRFYEHVIRNERDYIEVLEYIENNPSGWENDEYY